MINRGMLGCQKDGNPTYAADRHLRPAIQSLHRLLERSRRLHEQGADENRLRQYVQRWFGWLHSGLRGRVSKKGRFNQIWIYVLKHLQITSYRLSPR
jgi:hypothetical protein